MLLEVEVRFQGCRHKAVAAMKFAGRASCRQEDMAGAPGLASGNAYCGHRGRQTPQGCTSCPMAGFAGRYDPACSSKSVSAVTALTACMQSTLQQQNTTTATSKLDELLFLECASHEKQGIRLTPRVVVLLEP